MCHNDANASDRLNGNIRSSTKTIEKGLISQKSLEPHNLIQKNAYCSDVNIHAHYSDVTTSAMASHWPLWGELTGDRWIPLTKGQ